MDTEFAVRMVDITKHFGTITANKNVSLDIRKGEILSLLGENGSGKTTLMNMLSGIYYPDGGSIYVNGMRVDIRSPKDAFKLHIGMIHQHFKLVDVFTATENVKLGLKDSISAVRKSIVEICKKYSFAVDPDKKVYEMSVSEKQTLEIVKVLYRGADILILDEPTAVLTPQETEIMRTHPRIGYDILKGSPSKYLSMGAIIDPARRERITITLLAAETWNEDRFGPGAAPGETSAKSEKGKPANETQAELQLDVGQKDRGAFGKTAATMVNGEDLDIPTFIRRGVKLSFDR